MNFYSIAFPPKTNDVSPIDVPISVYVESTKNLSEEAGGLVFNPMRDQISILKANPEIPRASQTAHELANSVDHFEDDFRLKVAQIQENLASICNRQTIPNNDPTFLIIHDCFINCRQILTACILHWNQAIGEFISIIKKPSKQLQSHAVLPVPNEAKTVPEQPSVAPVTSVAPVALAAVLPTFSLDDQSQGDNLKDPKDDSKAVSDPSAMNEDPSERELAPSSMTKSCTEAVINRKLLEPVGSIEPGSMKRASQTEVALDRKSILAKLTHLGTISLPYDSSLHYELPVGIIPVVINDNEVSSLIAYSLASKDFCRN